ncbi:MAG: DNA mismatch repair endonuclease MutL, partial [Bryobacteraceae bacterium]
MGRIRVLPDQVANKIAAGEVVERPASVVKELLENSLDAGATRLRIDVESGGRRLLRITDDGSGMLRDDALLAFERHATSKLRDAGDLLTISTLGFRGEALPSIASVSRLLLETRSPEEATGTRVEIAGGKILACDEAALPPGTVITVRDLFFNVPARKKFLRSEQTELGHIASLVTHYSLAHPEKTIQLFGGGTELLHVTPVTTLRERVYQVFGNLVLDELVDLGSCERELLMAQPSVPPTEAIAEYRRDPDEPPSRTFSLRGFISRPQVQKANRNSIFIFVNGRLIRDRLLLHAISAAYYNLIPPGSFPFALLFLSCDCEEVDVNVHPSKTEVRFRHQSFVHDFVRDTMRNRLMEARPAPTFSPSPSPQASLQAAARLPYSEFTQQLENDEAASVGPVEDSLPVAPEAAPVDTRLLPEFTLRPPRSPEPRFDFGSGGISMYAPPAASQPVRKHVPESHGVFPPELISTNAGSLSGLGDLRPLGQIHESFIIAAGRDGLWIIDQHVAHERILFEKVLRQQAAGRVESQALLMPLIVTLTPEQQIEYARLAA